jgi:hypothetical protein
MHQPCNELAPEERADILRVRPQGAMCTACCRDLAQPWLFVVPLPGSQGQASHYCNPLESLLKRL